MRAGHLLAGGCGPRDYSQAYGLLSWQHGLDLLNEQLLVAPTVVLVLCGVRCVRSGGGYCRVSAGGGLGGRRAELKYNTGLAYGALADWPAARASYEEALDVQEDYAAARMRLVEIENNLAQ